MYSNTLVCFKIFHFTKFTFQNPNRCIWNRPMWKNKPVRGANFIVRPRAQNCLATPLWQKCVHDRRGKRMVLSDDLPPHLSILLSSNGPTHLGLRLYAPNLERECQLERDKLETQGLHINHNPMCHRLGHGCWCWSILSRAVQTH